jgi:small subunit ribosomal protein S6
MNKYELALVISAKLDDETRTAVLDRAKDYIARHGGTVGETQEWGKRKLAYEINHIAEGEYILVNFQANPTQIQELDRVLRINDAVLRHMIVARVVEEQTKE